jgi:hypothetical protein
MVAALEIIVSLGGWLGVFGWALSGPRLGRVGIRAGGTGQIAADSRVPPAIVALMAGLRAADQFKVTLLDLGTRGWFRLTSAGARAVCVIPVEAPVEELVPFEHIAVHHLARRAGTHTRVPADAIADGFQGGEHQFLTEFRREVRDQARARGLTRPAISLRRKTLLCLLALIPAAVPVPVAIMLHLHLDGLPSVCLVYYLVLCLMVVTVTSERLTSYGVRVLNTLGAVPNPGRVGAAALGRDNAVLAPFTAPGMNRAWSGYGENWRLITVGDPAPRVWPGMTHAAARLLFVVTLPGISVLMIIASLAGYGLKAGVLASLAIDLVVVVAVTAPWLRLPTRAEFEGQVLRQWTITGVDDDDRQWSCCVAIDDGTSPRAWALTVTGTNPTSLAPGSLVSVTVNPRLNKVLSIELVRSAVAAPHLLNPVPDPRGES